MIRRFLSYSILPVAEYIDSNYATGKIMIPQGGFVAALGPL